MTIDMGGTSFDIACSDGAEASTSRESTISGHPIAVAALDIHTLGAGGGSIAWVDSGGALRIGPQSAGSQPGPACYGRGGEHATVTDANVVLGRLGTELLGGRIGLDPDAANRAIERQIARPLGIDVVAAARGMVEVVNAAMAKGMHLMSVARGRDPRTSASSASAARARCTPASSRPRSDAARSSSRCCPGHLGDRPPARGSPPRAERSRPRAAGRARRERRGVDPRPAHARGRRRPGRRRGGKRDGHDSGGRAALVRGQRYQLDIPFLAGEWVGGRVPDGLVDGARRAVSRTSPLAVRLSPR